MITLVTVTMDTVNGERIDNDSLVLGNAGIIVSVLLMLVWFYVSHTSNLPNYD